MGIRIKSKDEIELIRISSLLVGNAIAEVAKALKPGITTSRLDQIAEQFIRDNGGVPVFKGYNGFPASLCISINAEVVHGIPGKREVKEEDIVSIDCGVKRNGFIGDSAYTFGVGEIGEEAIKLLKVTKESLYKAIEICRITNRVGDIGATVQQYTEENGFSIVRELVGHGVGVELHEKPEIPNYGKHGSGMQLKSGMVIAIEPMVNMGRKNVRTLSDGWTVVTVDNLPSAHFEHTVAITNDKADVLSSFDEIEKEERNNQNLNTYQKLKNA